MTDKQKEVLKAMEGMTYLEWLKLYQAINITFDEEASRVKNSSKITSLDTIAAEYERLF